MPGAHSRNVSRELRESSEGARVAILLAADDVEAGATEQSPAEQSAAAQIAAELSAAAMSADPPQLLPASDGMDAGPSSGASKAAQGGLHAKKQASTAHRSPYRGRSLNFHVWLWLAAVCFYVLPCGPASTGVLGS